MRKLHRKSKLVYGVGVNDADYPVKTVIHGKMSHCPFYSVWMHMLQRCYSKRYLDSKKTYLGASVAKQWHSFLEFKDWMARQDWEGMHLDKDIIHPGNKIYSQETCAFVTPLTNNFTLDSGASRGKYLIGVYWHKRDKRYMSKCCNPFTGKQENLGSFGSELGAHLAWKRRKHELSQILAEMQSDARVKSALKVRYSPEI